MNAKPFLATSPAVNLWASSPSNHSLPMISKMNIIPPVAVNLPSSSAKNQDPPQSIANASLSEKLVGDVLVATSVTFFVAPFLTVVDKAIVQSAAGSHTLIQSGTESVRNIIRHPVQYVKSPTFLLMWGVYAATYSTANCLKSYTEHQEFSPAATQKNLNEKGDAKLGKFGIFFGTTFVNAGSSLLKDRAYARMFGSNTLTSSIPKMTTAFWLARDLSVVGSSFILPEIVANQISKSSSIDMDKENIHSLCQFGLPIAAQFVAGPFHFLGLDLFNRRLDSTTWKDALLNRSKALYNGFFSVVSARIARIAPGYGIGGVFNTRLRNAWRHSIEERMIAASLAERRSAATLSLFLNRNAESL